jgi:hypothetical protein
MAKKKKKYRLFM